MDFIQMKLDNIPSIFEFPDNEQKNSDNEKHTVIANELRKTEGASFSDSTRSVDADLSNIEQNTNMNKLHVDVVVEHVKQESEDENEDYIAPVDANLEENTEETPPCIVSTFEGNDILNDSKECIAIKEECIEETVSCITVDDGLSDKSLENSSMQEEWLGGITVKEEQFEEFASRLMNGHLNVSVECTELKDEDWDEFTENTVPDTSDSPDASTDVIAEGFQDAKKVAEMCVQQLINRNDEMMENDDDSSDDCDNDVNMEGCTETADQENGMTSTEKCDTDFQEARKLAEMCVLEILTRKSKEGELMETDVDIEDDVISLDESTVQEYSDSSVELVDEDFEEAKMIAEKCVHELLKHKSDADNVLKEKQCNNGVPSPPETRREPPSETLDHRESNLEDNNTESMPTIKLIIDRIRNKPLLYIGVSNRCYFIIDSILNATEIPEHHLLLSLMKIRLDSGFEQLADHFCVSTSSAEEIFLKTIPVLAGAMSPFIEELGERNRDNDCVVHCLEIEVEKPTKVPQQMLTFSDSKNANTVKYLISCTVNGVINYVSPGFGGKTSKTCIIICGFLERLRTGMRVLADDTFEEAKEIFQLNGVKFVTLPEIATKVELKVRRLVRQLRGFIMLRPYDCVSLKLVKLLDYCVVIACALINLQNGFATKSR